MSNRKQRVRRDDSPGDGDGSAAATSAAGRSCARLQILQVRDSAPGSPARAGCRAASRRLSAGSGHRYISLFSAIVRAEIVGFAGTIFVLFMFSYSKNKNDLSRFFLNFIIANVLKSRIDRGMTVDWIRQGLKDTKQDAQRLGQSARALAFGRHRPPERHRAACAPRRSPSSPNISASSRRAWSAAAAPPIRSAGCRWSAMSAPARSRISTPTGRARSTTSRRPTRRARAPSRCRSAAIRSARCSTTGWCSTTTCTNPPDDSLIGRMCVCGLSDGRVLVKALKRSQVAGLVDAAFQHRAADLRRRARLGGAGARDAAALSGLRAERSFRSWSVHGPPPRLRARDRARADRAVRR